MQLYLPKQETALLRELNAKSGWPAFTPKQAMIAAGSPDRRPVDDLAIWLEQLLACVCPAKRAREPKPKGETKSTASLEGQQVFDLSGGEK